MKVDALGNPERLLLTSGQVSEYGQTETLIGGFAFEAVLAVRCYDSDAFVGVIQRRKAIIPSKKNCLTLAALIDAFTRLATWWSDFSRS